jgi:DNA-binding LytR/AlgR family response regulator
MTAEGNRPSSAHAWVLVLEDEARLRDELEGLLAALAPDLGPTRPAGSAEEAAAMCRETTPHIAFVDVRLPGRTGLEFVWDLPDDTRVVFVTAHDEYAMQAFDRGAVDYLLKPLSRERLQRCVDRLRNRLTPPVRELRSLLAAHSEPRSPPPLRWLSASSGRRTRLIPVEEVVYLQSDNRYTRVVSREGEHLIEEPIKSLLLRLDQAEFRQVHRSTVVNLREVLLVERDETGGGTLHLRNTKDVLRISAPYLREFKAFLE